MHFRYQMSIVGQAHDTVQMIDAFKKSIDQQLSNIIGSGLHLPNDLYAVYQKLHAYYNNCYQEYRRTTATHQSLRQLEEQIDNYRLMQNLFY